jgi:hypothetical protein
VGEIFKNFNLFIYGGLITDRAKFENLIGRKVDSIGVSGFGGFLPIKTHKRKRNVTVVECRIFYEFVKSDEFFSDKPRSYTIGEVELGVNYVLIIPLMPDFGAYNWRYRAVYFIKTVSNYRFRKN